MTRTVCHFLDSDTIGGCEQVVLSLLAGLDRKQWRPIVFHRESAGIEPFLRNLSRIGVPCCSVPRLEHRNMLRELRRFASELREASVDVFHAHLNWPLACRHELIAARLARVPAVVATCHLSSSLSGVRFGRLKQRIQAGVIDRYIAVSDDVERWLCRDLAVPMSKVRVVKNGVPLSRFEAVKQVGLSKSLIRSDRPVVLTCARLHREKGHIYLMQAAKLVPEALFIFAGDGPERGRLEEFARKIGVDRQVQFLGHREDIPELLAACDVFALPSLHEALGLSILEAMAATKPIVATVVGGIPETVIDGVTGLLVAPRDPKGLADAIHKLLSDGALAARIAEAGRRRAAECFSSEAMVRGVTRIYDELVPSCISETLRDPLESVQPRASV